MGGVPAVLYSFDLLPPPCEHEEEEVLERMPCHAEVYQVLNTLQTEVLWDRTDCRSLSWPDLYSSYELMTS